MAVVLVIAAAAWWFIQQRFLEIERQSLGRMQDSTVQGLDLVNRVKSVEERFDQLKTRQAEVETRLAAAEKGLGEGVTTARKELADSVAEARKLQADELAGTTKTLTDALAETRQAVDQQVAQVTERMSKADTRLDEAQKQQTVVKAFYDDLVRARQISLLVNAEQGYTNASQLLQLNGNVRTALVVLDEIQDQFSKADPADSQGLRKAVLGDIERLRALPKVDTSALAVKLDQVIASVGTLPMLAESASVDAPTVDIQTPALSAADQAVEAARVGEPGGAKPVGWQSDVSRWWNTAISSTREGADVAIKRFASLVTVRKVDDPDILLLGPNQRHAVRDNLRLLLLNARLELLNQQEKLFREDLSRASAVIGQLFDGRSKDVKAAQSALADLAAAPVSVDVPALTDTLAAVRAARSATEGKN